MQYFRFLNDYQKDSIFYKKPASVSKDSDKRKLEYALGATLYMPATRKDVADMIIQRKYKEMCSMVLCLEDSIGDSFVEEAQKQIVIEMKKITLALNAGRISSDELPLIFIRVRNSEQLTVLGNELGQDLHLITGFVYPKFSSKNAKAYLSGQNALAQAHGIALYGMPILESEEIINKLTRSEELFKMNEIMDSYKESILNIRIGATDLCGLFGIRRSPSMTIYDIKVISDLIIDIVNFFGRTFCISGAVWEYFENPSKIVKPQLRPSPFDHSLGEIGLRVRTSRYDDGLIKETILDLANGIHGKTVIHPTHLKIVQSLLTVSKEDYLDAKSIVEHANGTSSGGAIKSSFANKMNEIKPHLKWAQTILIKSDIYGVYHENRSYIDMLTEQTHATNLG
ncbi:MULTISPECIES: HpcH/HpaI aldolase/citrate lyase family protein [Bacillus]|uniref:Citrate lyase subunit beta n=2 Tax=Bacillus TaxID=1386 RepID=A0A0M4FK55_9BACI|nr:MULTISPECIES: HpcH/HpaI aldolase/citrate lyase family protein [Bacillus]ALC83661.1 citrate lyase subunit beta [Bacillus gobiensis]MBP1082685.1 citrate lyase beta subunit [Bacillus capparidis]MED1097090.1 HpcH/HpaI aldolase/citrate lyase family protein [Bacillus capparidis]